MGKLRKIFEIITGTVEYLSNIRQYEKDHFDMHFWFFLI